MPILLSRRDPNVPLQFSQKKAHEVPQPRRGNRVSEGFTAIMNEMARVAPDMVLEIETGDERAIRATRMQVTRAGAQSATPWQLWHVGTKVYAQPMEAAKRRRERSVRANLSDYRD
jgi:hypothetical protein